MSYTPARMLSSAMRPSLRPRANVILGWICAPGKGTITARSETLGSGDSKHSSLDLKPFLKLSLQRMVVYKDVSMP